VDEEELPDLIIGTTTLIPEIIMEEPTDPNEDEKGKMHDEQMEQARTRRVGWIAMGDGKWSIEGL
jgi:hypothetical protein